MNFLTEFFNKILYQPLFNALFFLYQFLPGRDFGIAVIVLTALIRLVLSPLMAQSLKSQKALSGIQEKVKEIQNNHKDNKEKQMQEILELYQKEKINPLNSLLPILIQLPLLIALYRVFWRGLQLEELNNLYSFIPRPEIISFSFLNLIDLSQPSLVLAILAGFAQFIQMKNNQKKSGQAASAVSNQMIFMFPFLTIFILIRMPSAVALYWITTTVLSIGQQYLIFRKA